MQVNTGHPFGSVEVSYPHSQNGGLMSGHVLLLLLDPEVLEPEVLEPEVLELGQGMQVSTGHPFGSVEVSYPHSQNGGIMGGHVLLLLLELEPLLLELEPLELELLEPGVVIDKGTTGTDGPGPTFVTALTLNQYCVSGFKLESETVAS